LKNFEAYEHFKLLLGKNADKVIEGKTKTPTQVTHDFIKKLLDEYKTSQNIDKLDGIVMTVPDTWVREESNRTARENIEGIFKKLGYNDSEFRLESEPVGAATYFCWSFEQKQGKEYTGYITVVDYGGGTLDVTLCEAMNGRRIKILESSCGYGEYNETNGCAGVAFDEAVIEKFIRDKNLPFKKGDSKFIKLRNRFEDMKITECEKITKDLKDYYDASGNVEGEQLFSLEYNDEGDTLDVCCEDLDQCFNKVNAPMLKKSLEQIKQYFLVHKVDSKAPEHFKVLLVGGFSNFYAVEKEVMESFDAKSGDIDKRFEQPEIRNRTLAISKGAALIAAGEFSIEHTCTNTYGYVRYGANESDELVPFYIPVIERGIEIRKLNSPKFADAKEYVRQKEGKLSIFMDGDAGRRKYALPKSIKELFPDVDDNDRDKWYQIGFSVNTVNNRQIPTVYIKDEHSPGKPISWNELIEITGISQ